MVISPSGQISYVENTKPEQALSTKKETITKEQINTMTADNNIVDLKANSEIAGSNQGSIPNYNNQAESREDGFSDREALWEEEKVDLKNLSPEQRIDIQATPSLASVGLNMDEDLNKDMTEWFSEYNKLPVNIKLGLGSVEVREAIKKFAIKNNLLNEVSLGEISRIIRDVYVKLIKASEIKNRLVSLLKIKQDTIDLVMKDIADIVTLVKDVGNHKSEEYFEKLSLKDILEKYPELATKEITAGVIIDKTTGRYLDPTIQNWINDYVNQMGSGQHTNLDRGKYLSNSTNVKNLDKDDKKIIEKLISSYDGNEKLFIDKEDKAIIWNIHDDEGNLGINSDKNKRVINKFKIEEAQTTDIDESQSVTSLSSKNSSPKSNVSKTKSNLENNTDNSIINNRHLATSEVSYASTNVIEKKQSDDNDLLDLSSEIPVKK